MTTVTLTESNRNLAGVYSETSLDQKKAKSNRLVSICGNYYTIYLLTGKTLEIKGKRNFDNWAKSNEYLADF